MEILDWENDPEWTEATWMIDATYDEAADIREHIPVGVLVEAGRISFYDISGAVRIDENGAQNSIVMTFGWENVHDDDRLALKTVTLGDDQQITSFANAFMTVMCNANPKLGELVGQIREAMNESGMGDQ
jgi:hypothetical protein